MKPTIKDIAERLGISSATVCNALGGKDGVNEQTRQDVLRVAAEIGYIQDDFTPPERTERAVIHVIVAKRPSLGELHPRRCSILLEAVESACTAQGFAVQVSYLDVTAVSSEDIRRRLRGCRGEGILLVATELDDADLASFSPIEIPLVLLDANPGIRLLDAAASNDMQGMGQAVSHLCEMGHTRIGLLCSSVPSCSLRRRWEGYRNALYANGLRPDASLEIALRPEISKAVEDMGQFLKNTSSLPTALVADSDLLAVSAMRAAALHGLRVPQELSVVGFGDTPYSLLANAALTSVREDAAGIGISGARMLLSRLKAHRRRGAVDHACLTLLSGTHLILRESVCKQQEC